MSKRFGLRRHAGIATFVVCIAALIVVPFALAGAINTSDDPGLTGTGVLGLPAACLNGGVHTTPAINCNMYVDKTDVFLSGSPLSAALGDGTFFFAVLSPGGQPSPNDAGIVPDSAQATPKNLSDDFDAWTNREFSLSGGTITMANSSTHYYDVTNNEVQVAPFADTLNNGGVYILAVCRVPSNPTGAPGVDPKDCKYDAFKVQASVQCDPLTNPGCQTPPVADLIVTKDATPTFTRDYDWSVAKSQTTSSTPIDSGASSVTVNYKVQATWSGPTDSGWQVGGTITVFNPNGTDFSGVTVSDAVDNGGTCVVTGGTNATIVANTSQDFSYTCSYSSAPSPLSGTNTATAAWDQNLYQTPDASADFLLPFAFDDGAAGNPTITHDTTTVSDTFNGGAAQTLGVAGIAPSWATDGSNHLTSFAESYDPGTQTFTLTYSRSVTVVPNTCTTYANTANVSGDATAADNSSSASVTVCGRVTGGLTMGFWQNKNGQGIIQNYSGSSCQVLATWLETFNPFKDLTATICGTSPSLTGKSTTATGVVGYVYNVIKAAVCTSTTKTCNAMLKAQMLATALDVYFSDPGLGGNRIGAPTALGGVHVDLTSICKMIDGSGGSATCSGSTENTASAFGGGTCQTVTALLLWSNATQGPNYAWGTNYVSNAGGLNWYGQVKATQVLAKDTFDSINNQVAFSC